MHVQKTMFKLIEMPENFPYQVYQNQNNFNNNFNSYNNYQYNNQFHFPLIKINNSDVEDTHCCTSNIPTSRRKEKENEMKPKMNKSEMKTFEKKNNQLQLTKENLIASGFGFLSTEDKNERVYYWIEDKEKFEETAFLPDL